MIGVTGATGQFGQIVIGLLKERMPADQIVALARDPAKAAALDLGVEVRPFDYNDPDQILAGLEGIDSLLLISGSDIGLREVQHRNVIFGAMEQNLGRIVYTSLLRANTSPLGLAQEHLATELILGESGIACTILRNGWYIENYVDTAISALAAGILAGAAGDGRISAAARADYAAAAVAVLTGEGHEGATYELSGDTAFTLADLAAELSKISGQQIGYRDMTEADYAEALADSGLAAPWPKVLARIDAQIAEGALYDEGTTLSTLIGRPTTPLGDVLAERLSWTA
ncbi:NAD(P)H-binding protein [Tropicimonas sp. IMCC34043]|uniref:NAD(P)H-binding protein n=1 Tax=Tropicimonas sp. IMCC34043 TaxID=2248760 RepID=UPI000E23C76A|nr:NAD(P)H-binding protein [Tropicimonas sp. IMCC34043]